MRGVCFDAVKSVSLRTLPDPSLESDSDAVVRVRWAGLCGSDLHPYFGRETGLDPATVMGHEFVGEVVAVGSRVTTVRAGDRVCSPFTTSCGDCFFCQSGLTARCRRGQLFGWRCGGKGLHGGQAEMVRVPLADGTLVKIPPGVSDELAILLGDNLSTATFALESADVCEDGLLGVVGCGTVGLLTIALAHHRGYRRIAAVEPNAARRDIARHLGAVVFADGAAADAWIREATDGRGADGVVELVGLADAQQLAYRLVRPGGSLAVIGCHCGPHFAFSPAQAYDKNLTLRTGRCSARSFMRRPDVTSVAASLDLSWCMTHRFPLDQGPRAYELFAGRQDGCVKALLECG